jgi:hypothetical protein
VNGNEENARSLLSQESLIDDDAIVCTNPFDPVKAKPCERLGRRRVELNVEDAVEKRPFENPIVVEVELNPAPAVNGKVPLTVTAPVAPEIVMPDPATRDVTPEFTTFPFEYASPLENVVVAPE